jgi:hypothetical protein
MPAGAHDTQTVRREVGALLTESAAFRALPLAEQQELSDSMVRVCRYLADPGWLDDSTPVRARALADQPDAVGSLKQRLADKQHLVGEDFRAGAMREGTEAFGQLVNKVDFPEFVSGLVKGVFDAVVNASIKQMKAYGDMLAATVKTLDQFMNDHVTEGQARDFIANRYPSAVVVDTSGERAKLLPRPGSDAIDIGKEFGLGEGLDISDEDAEAQLVAAARREMARSNQQLLATMVLLGINRIVVTNGKINAKVVFDIKTTDDAQRTSKAAMHDEQQSAASTSAGAAAWSPWGAGGATASASTSHATTVASAVDDTSSAKAEMKAQLSGDVSLSFKSETFPLERMMDSGAMQTLNDRAKLTSSGVASSAPGTAAAPTSTTSGAAR